MLKVMFRRVLIGTSAFCLLLVVLLGAIFFFAQSSGQQTLNTDSVTLIDVKAGTNLRKLLKELEEDSYIKHRWAVKLWIKLKPELANIKRGTYEILPGETLEQLLKRVASAKEKQWNVTLIEGQNWKQWEKQLASTEHLIYSDNDNQQILAQLGSTQTHVEGLFLPDTYSYTKDTEVTEILTRAYRAMQLYLVDAWARRDPTLPIKTPYEALILASIVEKETGLASERPHIAGVFVNRLENNMRLQSDPTTIYGLGDAFDGDLKRSDLRQKTPYNTYRINGLPPTPIAMVSKASIDAVMQPMLTNDLYFVARGDGSHQFSETLEEHNAAVRKYQLNRGNP